VRRPDKLFRCLVVVVSLAGSVLVPTVTASATPVVSEYPLSTAGVMPEDITVGPDGNLWFTDEGTTPAIGRATTAGAVSEFGAGQGFFPFAVAAGQDSLWFSSDGAEPGIGEITSAGQITMYPTGVGSGPTYLVYGPDSSMWFTDPAGHDLGSITGSGLLTSYTAGLNAGSSPSQLAVGADGEVWFTDQGTTPAIGVINQSGQITEYATGLVGHPGQIVLGPNGNLWFTEDSPGGFGEITPSGTITSISTGLAPGAEPYAIISGPDGDLWFTDRGTVPAVGEVKPSGVITEFTGLPTGSSPASMAFGADGNLWFTDYGTHSLGEVTPSGQVSEFVASASSRSSPFVILPGPDGNLWFTDPGDGAVGRVVTGSVAPPSAASPIPTTLVDSVLGSVHRFGGRLTLSAVASTPSSKPSGGTVTFEVGGLASCSAKLIAGSAKCISTVKPKAGRLIVLAHYTGTTVYRPSSAATLLKVSPALVKVTASRSRSSGGRFRYAAHVTVSSPGAAGPGGLVVFSTGKRTICKATLHKGAASCTSTLDPTTYKATYRPSSSNFEAATTVKSTVPNGAAVQTSPPS
jgi:streptogramin lyase